MSSATKKPEGARPVVSVLKGVIAAFILSLVLTALAALLLQKQVIPVSAVRIVNPVIKSLSALAAGFFGTARTGSRRWLFGAVAALAYIIATTVVFGLLAGGIHIGSGNLADLAMCGFAGCVGGMLRSLRAE